MLELSAPTCTSVQDRFLARVTVRDDSQGIGLLLGDMILLTDDSQVGSTARVRPIDVAGVVAAAVSDSRPG